jgi:hypothetical protein
MCPHLSTTIADLGVLHRIEEAGALTADYTLREKVVSHLSSPQRHNLHPDSTDRTRTFGSVSPDI